MRTVDIDRNVDILVRCSYENLDIFEEGPCWWLRTRRCVFLSGIFSRKESGSFHDCLYFARLRYELLFPPKILWSLKECGCQLSETFLAYKSPIRTCHAEHADRSLISQEFEFMYSHTRAHSAFCQTRSLKTRF